MKKLTIASFCLTLGVSCLLLVVPLYSANTSSRTVSISTHSSMLEVIGGRVLIPLIIPVLIALMPIISPHRWVSIGTTVILAIFVFVAGFTVGLFYLPSAVILFVATMLRLESHSE